MFNPLDSELLIFVLSFLCFWVTTWMGSSFRRTNERLEGKDREEFLFVLGGALTLLGLIVGFTFSMAVSRYDLRKQYEEQEANTIGTEYSRADLLPAADVSKVHALLRTYLDQRILHTLILAGMNEAKDSQGYAQAASWNRIPIAAWILMAIISLFCNFLVGYSLPGKSALVSLILPIALSASFFLIADIDTPNKGFINVRPQNLTSLADSLRRAAGPLGGPAAIVMGPSSLSVGESAPSD